MLSDKTTKLQLLCNRRGTCNYIPKHEIEGRDVMGADYLVRPALPTDRSNTF